MRKHLELGWGSEESVALSNVTNNYKHMKKVSVKGEKRIVRISLIDYNLWKFTISYRIW